MRLLHSLMALLLVAAAPALADPSLQRVLDAKTLKIGVAANAPWVIKKPDGSLAGYDIDLGTALAKDLGVTPSFVELPFDGLVDAVAKGQVDLAAAGLAITPERARAVAFSSPTGYAVIRTVARLPEKGATAFAEKGYTIAVIAGSADEAAARASYPKATIATFPSEGDALGALVGGKAQAMVAKSPVPRMVAKLYDGRFRLVGEPLSRTAEALALGADSDRLRTYVDNWLTARTADGTLANWRTYWFGNLAWVSDLDPNKKPAK